MRVLTIVALTLGTLSLGSLALGSPSARAADRLLIGDAKNGDKLLSAAGFDVKVDGAWINQYPDDVIIEKMVRGDSGFPQIDSENVLDRWDALAALRAKNTDLKDLLNGADAVLVMPTKLDEHAVGRLKDQAKIPSSAIDESRTVYGLYKTGAEGLAFVGPKENKKRDKLKKDTKVGYAVFLPIPGFRGGKYEAAFAIDKDIRIVAVTVRGPDGSASTDLNQAAARFVGKGARGQYAALKAGGAGKALGELAGPLSDAFLLAAESVYMLEVDEREYFQF